MPQLLHLAWLLLLTTTVRLSSGAADYWSAAFEQEANCKQAELINNELKHKGQCESIVTGEDSKAAFMKCKEKLQKRLVSTCSTTKIQKAGELLYCKSRGFTECCFTNHKCEPSWNEINKSFGKSTALSFLQDKNKTLEIIEKKGYKKCYAIDGYDVSKCAEDCKQAETEDFAKNCTSQGGFFKCCIRRDKHDCHQCRFCCSLPLCAYNTSEGVQHQGMAMIDEKDQANSITALEIFSVERQMYKAKDYRCLKPDTSIQNSSEWPHYVHADFKQATTKEQLDKANTIKFDVNFLNFEDPEVFDRLAGPEYENIWKTTYGLDFVTRLLFNHTDNSSSSKEENSNFYPLAMHCIESEFSDFAKKCQKNGGLYKCCFNGHDIQVFERVQVELANMNFIEKAKKVRCGEVGQDNECIFLMATHACTTKNLTTGSLTTEFQTPTIPQYTVGGNPSDDPQWSGARTDYCSMYNSCHNEIFYFKPDLYERAADKESFCSAMYESLVSIKSSAITQQQLDHLKSTCTDQQLSTVFLCEDEALMEGEKARKSSFLFRDIWEKMTKKKKKNKAKRKKGSKNKKTSKRAKNKLRKGGEKQRKKKNGSKDKERKKDKIKKREKLKSIKKNSKRRQEEQGTGH